MAQEVYEVTLSHEVSARKFGGRDIEVEVDECFLTIRKAVKCAPKPSPYLGYTNGQQILASTFKCATVARHVIGIAYITIT